MGAAGGAAGGLSHVGRLPGDTWPCPLPYPCLTRGEGNPETGTPIPGSNISPPNKISNFKTPIKTSSPYKEAHRMEIINETTLITETLPGDYGNYRI